MKQTTKQKAGVFLIKNIFGTKELFSQVRTELNAHWRSLWNKMNWAYRQKLKKINEQSDISVNIGAGPFGEKDWINLDLHPYKNITLAVDCRKKLPFRDGIVARIRCEHFFEHLDRNEQAPFFLAECLRILKKDGIMRIIVPDLELFIRTYVEDNTEKWRMLGFDLKSPGSRFTLPMEVLNHTFRQDGEHKFGYDFKTLENDLYKAGFGKVEKKSWGDTSDILLANDLLNHRPYSLYVEAVK